MKYNGWKPSIFFILAILVVMLGACGGDSSSSGSASTTQRVAQPVSNQIPSPSNSTDKPVLVLLPQNATSMDNVFVEYTPVESDRNEPLQFTVDWKVNGFVVNELLYDYLPAEYFKGGDTVSIDVLVSDSVSETTYSQSIVIANSAPEGRAEITPAGATAADELVALTPYLFDADDDSISITYHWQVNGVPIPGEHAEKLAPGNVVVGDIVSVQLELSDNTDTAMTQPVSVVIADAPAVLVTESLPDQIPYGEPLTFNVMFSDPDNSENATTLIDAPDGFTYNAATSVASWTPDSFMLSAAETFTATFASAENQEAEVRLNVVDSSRLAPMAKSGVEVPGRYPISMDIGDFDGDGAPEVLSSDLVHRLFTLEFDGDELVQDWMYPFAMPAGQNIRRLWTHGENSKEVLVVTTNMVMHIPSRDRAPEIVYESTEEISTAAHGDIDSDGKNELILVSEPGELLVLQTDSWVVSTLPHTVEALTREARIWFDGVHSIILANVDADPALEIISGTGEIVDALTGALEWKHTERFGSHLAMGDINGDGVDELVAADRWKNAKSFDMTSFSVLAEYEINDTCNIIVHNIDLDAQEEIFHGGCQRDELSIYDVSSGAAEVDMIVDNEAFSSAPDSMSVGDIDSDGIDELVFATGTHTTGNNAMGVVAFDSLGDTTPDSIVLNNWPAEFGWFQLIGWDTNSAGVLNAVLTLPATESYGPYSDGHRIGILSESGGLIVSGVTQNNYGESGSGFVVDSDGDNVSEVVLQIQDGYDGLLEHRDLDDDFSIRYSSNDEGTRNVGTPVLAYNNANNPVAVYKKGTNTIAAFDMRLGATVWNSEVFDNTLNHLISINTNASSHIVAATTNEISVWHTTASGFAKRHAVTISCSRIASVKVRGEYLIACVQNNSWWKLADNRLITFDMQLIKLADKSLDLPVFDPSETSFNVEVSAMTDDGQGHLVLGSGIDTGFGFPESRSNYLHKINPLTGNVIWTSMPLIGKINAISFYNETDSGKRRLGVSTSFAVYLSR